MTFDHACYGVVCHR